MNGCDVRPVILLTKFTDLSKLAEVNKQIKGRKTGDPQLLTHTSENTFGNKTG